MTLKMAIIPVMLNITLAGSVYFDYKVPFTTYLLATVFFNLLTLNE
jgi:hypothetical protein